MIRTTVTALLTVFLALSGTASAGLFGYQENARSNLNIFPQWLSVLERHIKENVPEGDCSSRVLDKCHIANWHSFLAKIQKLPELEQIKKVNDFANQQKYILDIENYGLEDYWATPKEFLYNNGDCEDYAITKMLSLRALGFTDAQLKLVVLQDTNLRIPHAVLAVNFDGDTLIMDNQIAEVISHRHIVHYVPIYSVSQKSWWMYLPEQMK